ncbi:MAG: TIGR03808 family TAT-translocated repetitive protein [Proteobacteria bacterium]|nr:TIGR03808 family TAT-translocated repetitive protein [Pseudomonadota bacterium]
MSLPNLKRRSLFLAALGAAAGLPAAAMAAPRRRDDGAASARAPAHELGVVPDAAGDQSAAFQAAVDQAAANRVALELPAGRYRVSGIRLRPSTRIVGMGEATTLVASAAGAVLVADGADGVRLDSVAVEASPRGAGTPERGLIELAASRDIAVERVVLRGSPGNGLVLRRCAGRILHSRFELARFAGIFSLDAMGLEITGNHVTDCADNGILVWRSSPGDDGTIVSSNRIERIGAASGGSGQNGNGVNVYRAGNVQAHSNRITACAYSAVRANAASNVSIVGNTATDIGEVALYAEFGSEGAVIAQNIVDRAAAGISVTNFNEGGRLAVIQGNLVRNLKRREQEPVDKRGEGITVEADAAVTGNTIENAATAGIVVGWGRYMRDVAATSNVIRNSPIGVLITRDPSAGTCLVSQNLISGARNGAIRLMDGGLPIGDDLVQTPPRSDRLVVTGNAATV